MDKRSHEVVWQECLEVFRDNLNPQSFKTWFEPIKPVRLSNKILTIQVPSQFFYEFLEEHFVQLLHKTLKKIIGPNAKLEYSIIVENGNSNQESPFTINLPTGNSSKPVNNELGMPISLETPIKNPFIIPRFFKPLTTIIPYLNFIIGIF